jgi:hypothetical protein
MCSDVAITWDLGAANVPTNVFTLKYHNFSAAATITLMGNTANSWTSPAFSQIITWVSGKLSYFFGTSAVPVPQTYRYWRLRVQDAANPDTLIKIGRIFHGTFWSPSVNFTNAYTRKFTDTSQKQYSTGGQMSAVRRPVLKEMKFVWDTGAPFSFSDRTAFSSIFEDYVGIHIPYFLCQDADDLSTMYYVENLDPWEFVHIYMENYFGMTVSVREVA